MTSEMRYRTGPRVKLFSDSSKILKTPREDPFCRFGFDGIDSFQRWVSSVIESNAYRFVTEE